MTWAAAPIDLLDELEVERRRDVRTVNLCAGPGGWDEGARILGLDLAMEGLDISTDACTTARAAGHSRRLVDVATVAPTSYPGATGLIASPPCPTFSTAGRQEGCGRDYQAVLDVWTSIGWGIPPLEALADIEGMDPRTAMLAIAGTWAMTMENLQWFAMEQVPAVDHAFQDLVAEFAAMEWMGFNIVQIDSRNLGVPSRRARTFIVAHRDQPVDVGRGGRYPDRAMSDALGWPRGHDVITRGQRRTPGGNAFNADQPSWCLTGRARSWQRDDGLHLTPKEAGLLSGFRYDYPWTGSRTSQFQQAGDVVSPIVAAAVLGGTLGQGSTAAIEHELDLLYDPLPSVQPAVTTVDGMQLDYVNALSTAPDFTLF